MLKKITALDAFWHYALHMIAGSTAHITAGEATELEALGLVTVEDADEGATVGLIQSPTIGPITLEVVEVPKRPLPPKDDGKVIEPTVGEDLGDLLGDEKAAPEVENKMEAAPSNKAAKTK